MELLAKLNFEILVLSTVYYLMVQSEGSFLEDLVKGKKKQGKGVELKILPEPESSELKILIFRVNETLNLTCKVLLSGVEDRDSDSFSITWTIPSTPSNHTRNEISKTELNLIVFNIQPEDEGDYICGAKSDVHDEESLQSRVKVVVKSRKGKCGGGHFSCSPNECIPKRFLCDGWIDCKHAEDETIKNCGENPCSGKIMCSDKRCIPRSLCCDRFIDQNCSTHILIPCCLSDSDTYGSPYVDRYPGHYIIHAENGKTINLLPSTIFTVVGCALAFVFIVTILVIAICRVQMRRTAFPHMSRIPNGHHSYVSRHCHGYRNQQGVLQEPQIESYSQVCTNNMASFLVTYNINSGIQMLGHPVSPPSYSEVISLPHTHGPPPPYASVNNLNIRHSGSEQDSRVLHPLLDNNTNNSDENGYSENNNGDINGNSFDTLPEAALLQGGTHNVQHFH